MSMSLVMVSCFVVALSGVAPEPSSRLGVLMGVIAAWVVVGAAAEGGPARRITAARQRDAEGNAKVLTLSFGGETVTLDPGKLWSKVDSFKWVTRGLIEEPQSFHVLADGTVEVNGEKISLNDPEGTAKLEHEINKRHSAVAARKTPVAPAIARTSQATAQAQRPDRVHFKVRLDNLGHLMVECLRGSDRVETGLRGLPTMIQNGLMLKPKSIHIDPLMRAIEIDDARFECNEAGAHQLEEALNARYAPKLQAEGDSAVEIKENPAASTGYGIRFVTVRAGARFEIKGHLSQENLDILQDPRKCDLLRSGIVLRLSPPFLLIRRRRPDSSEEKIPELPDVQYRHVTALQLQRILNHPLIRRIAGPAGLDAASAEREEPKEIIQMRLERNPHNKLLLWLKCVTTKGGEPEGKAFTHHNIADLQRTGVFRPEIDVSLSLDHRTLRILNKPAHQEESITVDLNSAEADLAKAGQMLTAALKPPTPRMKEPPVEVKATPALPEHGPQVASPDASDKPSATPTALHGRIDGATATVSPPEEGAKVAPPETEEISAAKESTAGGRQSKQPVGDAGGSPSTAAKGPEADRPSPKTSVEAPKPASPPEPPLDQTVLALFQETDPLRINNEVFGCLARHLGIPIQDVRLSLPRVFDNRRFQVVSSSHPEVVSVLELRSGEFSGFYLSHINERKIVLVFARDGKHIDWGPDKCALQAAVTAEPDEFKGGALLGMTTNQAGHFIFVVTPGYMDWAKPREKLYEDMAVHFATAKDIAIAPAEYSFIWPEP